MSSHSLVGGLQRVGLAVVVLLGLVVSSARIDAQSATGAIQGTVVDQSGGVLPGATVTITNTATGAVRSTVTDNEGRFSAELLPVGPYEVSIGLQGFAARKLSDINLTIG